MIGVPERVQVNVLDGGDQGVVVRVGVGFTGFDMPFSTPFFLFADPTTAPTITARRAKKPTVMIIVIPLFVR